MSDERPTRLYPEPLPSRTGTIRSAPPTDAYAKAWDRIFGKKRKRRKRKKAR